MIDWVLWRVADTLGFVNYVSRLQCRSSPGSSRFICLVGSNFILFLPITLTTLTSRRLGVCSIYPSVFITIKSTPHLISAIDR